MEIMIITTNDKYFHNDKKMDIKKIISWIAIINRNSRNYCSDDFNKDTTYESINKKDKKKCIYVCVYACTF